MLLSCAVSSARRCFVAFLFLAGVSSLAGQTVSSTTVLTVTPNNPAVGTVITMTAAVTVNGVKAGGGTVSFEDGTVVIGTGQVIFSGPSAGSAIFKSNSFIPGTHHFKAVFGGAPNSAQKSRGSISNSVAVTFTKALSSTALFVDPNGANYNLRAVVSGLGKAAPGGEVRFTNVNTGQVYDRSPTTATPGVTGFSPLSPLFLDLPAGANFLYVADFNNDGRPDIYAAGLTADCPCDYGAAQLLFNTGTGFKPGGSGGLGYLDGFFFVDMNNDGLPDIVVQDNVSEITVSLNSAAQPGTFTYGFSDYEGETPQWWVGDFNADGVMDLFAQNVGLFPGDPDHPGTFLPQVASPFEDSEEFPLLVADLNGDGLPDVVTNAGNVYLRNPAHPDQFLTPYPLGAGGQLYDFNGDGLPDFVEGGAGLTVYLNDPANKGHFLPPVTYPGISYPYGNYFYNLLDLNGDRALDLLSLNSKNQLVAELGDPLHPGKFSAPITYPGPPVQNLNSLSLIDLNGDGLVDYATPVNVDQYVQGLDGENLSSPIDYVGLSYASVGSSTYTVPGVSLSTTRPSDVTAAFTGDTNYLPSSTEAKFTGIADLSVNWSALSYGAQPVGTTGIVHLQLKNIGQLPLTLKFQLSGPNVSDFVLNTGVLADSTTESEFCPSVLAVNASCSVQLFFEPAAVGERLATLTILGNGGPLSVTKVIPLAGPGLPALPGGPLTFSPVVDEMNDQLVGTSSGPSTITVTNSSGGAVQITNIASGGDDPGDFPIYSNTCLGTLNGGATCKVRVEFKPSAKGSRTGRINYSVTQGGTTIVQQSVVYGKGL